MIRTEEPHLRYLVFEFSCYYPTGGLGDCEFSTDDKEVAYERARSSDYDFRYVYDREIGETIMSSQY